jgi:L-lactate dehydrogenase complex protein LldG
MSEARAHVLTHIRRALGRGRLAGEAEAALEARLAAPRRNLVPARAAALGEAARIDLFVAMAEEANATVARVAGPTAVPKAVADYLARENLAAECVMAPDPNLDAIPWPAWPLLRVRRGGPAADAATSLTPAFAAIAETGTLMLISGADTPTGLNFLPETHIVVLGAGQIVATYEDGWDRLRALGPSPRELPRSVNFITGPSRTADIEQQLVQGMHGPRRLHIVLVERSISGDDERTQGTPGSAGG